MFQSHNGNHGLQDGVIRIIIADDEPALRLGFKYTLANETTDVETAENGRVALEMATKADYDLMILDFRMPDMDGIAVLKALRGQGNQTPIILCSAGFTPGASLHAIRNGVVDFLLKPMTPGEIRKAVESILNPKPVPLEDALGFVRRGDQDEAIRILSALDQPSPLELHWLRVLETMRNAEPGTDAVEIEKRIGASLSRLALNAPATE
jgi:DNA-binding response OmpR family regulator